MAKTPALSNFIAPRWDGEACAVLASGPSMSQQVADAARGLRTIVINNTFRLAPWADMLYAADALWWTQTKDAREFAGLKVTCRIKNESAPFSEVKQLQFTGVEGYDPTPGCVRTGNNSGYQAVHVAVQAGCNPILLCGFDMRGGHWHDRHAYPLRDAGEGIYGGWIRLFAKLAAELKQRGTQVYNCTPDSALQCFPKLTFDEACAMHAKNSADVSA